MCFSNMCCVCCLKIWWFPSFSAKSDGFKTFSHNLQIFQIVVDNSWSLNVAGILGHAKDTSTNPQIAQEGFHLLEDKIYLDFF